MITHHKFLAISAALFVVSGCTGSTNPETASLFDNINNLQSGEYDRQIASNQAQAAAIQRNNAQAQSRIAALDAEKSANVGTIRALNAQIASARQSGAAARAAASGDPAKLATVRALDSQLSAVASEVSAGTADPSAARLELRRIQRAYSSITG